MKIENVTCYSFHLKGDESLAHLRLIGPIRQAGLRIIDGIVDDQIQVDCISEGDIVIIQRDFPKRYNDYRKIIQIAHKEGKPVVFDLDDLLFFLPENHPGRQMQYYATTLLPMYQAMTEADLITVSTPKLGEVIGEYHDNVAVLPNYFDDTIWQLKPPVQKKVENEILTIGYMGGFPHKPDLEYIAPVLRDLLERYPDRVRLHFWGLEPPEEIRSFSQVTYTLSYNYSYRDFATYFQAQSADIFLAPLVSNLFNRCKSPIKFFEYSALGVPGVFSRLETYGEVVTDGKNGLLASTLDEWSECIIQMIEHDELRYKLASNAQATIRAGWLLSQNGYRWEETYRKRAVVSLHAAQESQEGIVQSINTQLTEMFTKKENEIQGLTKQIVEKEEVVQALTALADDRERNLIEVTEEKDRIAVEIAQYAASTSWRITRPLRRMMGKIKRIKKPL